eukprot:CAMPEP_0183334920 /NCGR_PEP_ID=MMETSP0164_2-20130417/3377_1 /TAXON_ID=221442 /ORGANISM="Coccolithus pelagicus ssp braarudi, Strain PLY182g" /LENGTH=84 /DNA_ID=CAMNT_0025504165 /DNA_START=33 /DNA_END=284 /DNA_ORIENTATION=+
MIKSQREALLVTCRRGHATGGAEEGEFHLIDIGLLRRRAKGLAVFHFLRPVWQCESRSSRRCCLNPALDVLLHSCFHTQPLRCV